jgi:ATP-binding cassette subfamily F protein uup
VLVLDEPTNDLDIETLELLEALLQDYAGTVFLVSHDRAFLDNVVTQTIASEGCGKWKEYVGGYSDWLRQRPSASAPAAPAPPKKVGAGDTAKNTATPTDTGRKKPSFKDQKELEQLVSRLAVLEAEQTQLHAQLADPGFYQRTLVDQQAAHARVAVLESEINTAMTRWEQLEEKISS